MERLTVNDLNKVCYDPWELCGMDSYCKKGCHEEGGCTKGCHILKMYRKLAEYEDLEEQKKLLKLPCAVGDIIYEVSYENREFVIKEHIVKEFAYRKYRFPRIEIYCENENGFLVCNIIGKLDECLFLTRPEAEAKLIEMEGKK